MAILSTLERLSSSRWSKNVLLLWEMIVLGHYKAVLFSEGPLSEVPMNTLWNQKDDSLWYNYNCSVICSLSVIMSWLENGRFYTAVIMISFFYVRRSLVSSWTSMLQLSSSK